MRFESGQRDSHSEDEESKNDAEDVIGDDLKDEADDGDLVADLSRGASNSRHASAAGLEKGMLASSKAQKHIPVAHLKEENEYIDPDEHFDHKADGQDQTLLCDVFSE